MSLRIIFAGTPLFAIPTLHALEQSSHQLVAVFTQPDRRAGRGKQWLASAVKTAAVDYNLDILQPEQLNGNEHLVQQYQPDVMVVIAYGLLLPQSILKIPKYGCLNVHASLLPRWRGAAPIQRAIEAGDQNTGVCIMQMEKGLDTGPVLSTTSMAIKPHHTSESLSQQLAQLGAGQMMTVLNNLADALAHAKPQDNQGVTYAHKISKSESAIDFSLPANVIEQKIRAFDPWPGSQCWLDDQRLRIWTATPLVEPHSCSVGKIIAVDDASITVACGENSLRITEVQKDGGRRMPASDFVRGTPITVGQQLR